MNELISLIQKHVSPGFRVEPATPLLSSGLIDSFRLTTLLTNLEVLFNIKIEPGEIGVDNFDTAEQIHDYIQANR